MTLLRSKHCDPHRVLSKLKYTVCRLQGFVPLWERHQPLKSVRANPTYRGILQILKLDLLERASSLSNEWLSRNNFRSCASCKISCRKGALYPISIYRWYEQEVVIFLRLPHTFLYIFAVTFLSSGYYLVYHIRIPYPNRCALLKHHEHSIHDNFFRVSHQPFFSNLDWPVIITTSQCCLSPLSIKFVAFLLETIALHAQVNHASQDLSRPLNGLPYCFPGVVFRHDCRGLSFDMPGSPDRTVCLSHPARKPLGTHWLSI